MKPTPTPPSAFNDGFLPHPSPEGLIEFKRLYHARFGVELDPKEALDLATRLIHLAYFALTPCPFPPPSPNETRP